jgi:hypothetical protein
MNKLEAGLLHSLSRHPQTAPHLCDVGAEAHAHPACDVEVEARLPHRVTPQHVRGQTGSAHAVWVHASLAAALQVLQPPQGHVI